MLTRITNRLMNPRGTPPDADMTRNRSSQRPRHLPISSHCDGRMENLELTSARPRATLLSRTAPLQGADFFGTQRDAALLATRTGFRAKEIEMVRVQWDIAVQIGNRTRPTAALETALRSARPRITYREDVADLLRYAQTVAQNRDLPELIRIKRDRVRYLVAEHMALELLASGGDPQDVLAQVNTRFGEAGKPLSDAGRLELHQTVMDNAARAFNQSTAQGGNQLQAIGQFDPEVQQPESPAQTDGNSRAGSDFQFCALESLSAADPAFMELGDGVPDRVSEVANLPQIHDALCNSPCLAEQQFGIELAALRQRQLEGALREEIMEIATPLLTRATTANEDGAPANQRIGGIAFLVIANYLQTLMNATDPETQDDSRSENALSYMREAYHRAVSATREDRQINSVQLARRLHDAAESDNPTAHMRLNMLRSSDGLSPVTLRSDVARFLRGAEGLERMAASERLPAVRSFLLRAVASYEIQHLVHTQQMDRDAATQHVLTQIILAGHTLQPHDLISLETFVDENVPAPGRS
jgi:hypothetical protein